MSDELDDRGCGVICVFLGIFGLAIMFGGWVGFWAALVGIGGFLILSSYIR